MVQEAPSQTVWPPPPQRPQAVPAVSRPLSKGQVSRELVVRAAWQGLTRGALCGAGYGVFFYIIGSIYGLVVGAVAGLILGLVTGLVLAGVTCRYFYPIRDAGRFRQTAAWIGAGLALTPGAIAAIGIVEDPDNSLFFVFLVLVPSLIAGLAARAACRRLADWYVIEALKQGVAGEEQAHDNS